MPDPAVGTVSHQRVLLPRHDRVGQVPAQGAEHPHEQQSGDQGEARSSPAQPDRQWYRRPRHPCRVDEIRDQAEHPCDACSGQGRVRAVEVPAERAIDIDTLLDFRIAECLLKNRHHDGN